MIHRIPLLHWNVCLKYVMDLQIRLAYWSNNIYCVINRRCVKYNGATGQLYINIAECFLSSKISLFFQHETHQINDSVFINILGSG
jgi:hypothetical protein